MIDVYNKLMAILDSRDRVLAFYVLLLTLVVAIIEVLGVASIMPFMAVLTNPEIIETNAILSFTYEFLNFQSTENFLFFLGICVLFFLVGSTFLKGLVVWAHIYYANIRNFSISSRIVAGYLQQPYSWFLSRNSSSLAASVLEEVSRVINGCLYPLMRLVSNVIVAILLFSLLIYADPLLAIGAFLILGLSYGATIKMAGKHLSHQGLMTSKAQNERLQAINEAFGGIKDVKIGGFEGFFLDQYRKPAKQHALASISSKLWAEMPSFAMQALVFGGMMIAILYLMETREGFNEAVPVLALYSLGVYKLMPALQEVYKQLVEIKFHQSALDVIHHDISLLKSSDNMYLVHKDEPPLEIDKLIELKDIKFSYPEADKQALSVDSIKIEKNSTVGFVGESGAGKTTVVDIILGLLQSSTGGIFVDDQIVNEINLRKWQKNLGYVPQQIYLSDDTIAANIAFGLRRDEIDYDAVEKATRIAHLHEFIVGELDDGYDTGVGERGMRLSGGQRQRIGIARALYHDPDILILDEATSALDNVTEKIIMDAVEDLGHKKTIIIIAHRLSTIRHSDKLFLFERGNVVATGRYDELIESSAAFREMAQIQNP